MSDIGGMSRSDSDVVGSPSLTDAVEKGKMTWTENFPCEPVETSIRECSRYKELTKAAGWKSDR